MRVLAPAQYQGTLLSAALVNQNFQPFTYVGSLELGASDLADPNLSIFLEMEIDGQKRGIETDWQGGPSQSAAPQVSFTGYARHTRLWISILRSSGSPTVCVGADIVQTSP